MSSAAGRHEDKTDNIVPERALKIADAEAKRDEVLTPKQLQGLMQVAAAGAKALKDGTKTAQEVAADEEAAAKAVNLTDAQRTKFAAGQQAVAATHENLNEALRGVLASPRRTNWFFTPPNDHRRRAGVS